VSSDLEANVQGVSVQVDTEHPKLEGMYVVHEMYLEAFEKCVNAMRLVSEAEYVEEPNGDFHAKLQFALGMFDVFSDLFGEKYWQELDKVKRKVGNV
jgi:hypothetical protein